MEVVQNPVKVQKQVAEPANTKFPTIIVEKISQNEGKNPYMLLRWVTQRTGGGNAALTLLLGGNNVENRVTAQTVLEAQVEALGIKPGINLNELFAEKGIEPIRLAISEITEEEYNSLSETSRIGYSQKMNPTKGEVLLHSGTPIYRKVSMESINTPDVYLTTQGSIKSEASDLAS